MKETTLKSLILTIFNQCLFKHKNFIRIFLSYIFIILSWVNSSYAKSIVLLPDAASNGAAVESDPLYTSTAEEIISALNMAGFKVAQSEFIHPKHMPRRRRPSTKDWRWVFQREDFNADFLVSLKVTRHIERSPVNQSQIGITAMLFEKNTGVRPIAVISQPPSTRWTVHPRCFGPCLTAYYARNVKPLARSIGKKLVNVLQYATTRSSHSRTNNNK
tara:strand:- start:165 stop:815 length:651 start_codon:yes stop_codon:yes gene_type:complete